MKIGDYVRTEYGITRIEEIKPDETHKTIWYTVDKAQYYTFTIKEQDILKSSSEIIDLIEVGDYVNGILINEKYIDINGNMIVKNECDDDYYSIAFENKNIKSIVTKEQFESMEYKVENNVKD